MILSAGFDQRFARPCSRGDLPGGPLAFLFLRQAQGPEQRVEVERDALGVARLRPLEHQRAHRAERLGLGPPERSPVEGDAGRPADALAVDVDERAARVEEDGPNSLHPPSSARTAASSASARAWTSA